MAHTPESQAVWQASNHMAKSLEDLRQTTRQVALTVQNTGGAVQGAVDQLRGSIDKASASTDRLGKRMVWLTAFAAVAAVCQAAAAIVQAMR